MKPRCCISLVNYSLSSDKVKDIAACLESRTDLECAGWSSEGGVDGWGRQKHRTLLFVSRRFLHP